MQTLLFSVFDTAAGRFLDPFVAPTIEVAIRGFRSVVNKPGHPFNDHPEDYTLFHVAEFDAESGTMSAPAAAVKIGAALSFLEVSDEVSDA